MADTISGLFASAHDKYRNKSLFRYYDGSWKTMSYGDFFSLTKDISAMLANHNPVKGDTIAVVSENRPEWCASYLAIVGYGCIAVPIDIQLGSDEIRNLLMDSGAKIAFCCDKTESNVVRAIEGLDIKKINFDDKAALSGFPPFSHRDPNARSVNYPAAPDDIASIIYTSGTTGKPKGVLLTHGNFCSDARALIQANVVTHDDNVLAILPLHHTYPFMCTFLAPLFLGATITFGTGLKAPDLLSAIKENGVTVLLGVPRLFEMLRNGIIAGIREQSLLSWALPAILSLSGMLRRRSGLNMGRIVFASVHGKFFGIRFFASGGARLDPTVMSDLEAMGFTVLEGYGLTETSPVITFNPPEKRKPGSAGKPLPGIEIKIRDDGEIIVKGPVVMKGYYKNEKSTREAITDGWLFTGDLGYIDKEGYLFITGRKKEVIVLSSGKNVYPEEVETAYMTIPLIKEICVTGIERSVASGLVDAVQAVIVPDFELARQNSIGNINDELSWKINEVSARLPEFMRIRGYRLSSEPLPRTPLGKLRRFMVQDILRKPDYPGKAAQKGDNQLMADPVGRKVADCIGALVDDTAVIRASDNIELELGFDSLRKLELIASLENVFAANLPETFISEAHTVADIVALMKKYTSVEGRGPTETGTLSWKMILDKELSPADANKIGYEPGLADLMLVYAVLMGLKLFCKIVFRLEVEGREHIRGEGAFVITPNHASYLDGFIIAASLPFSTFRRLYFLGLQEFFTGGIKSWFGRLSHVIPIDAETYLNKALQLSSYVLKGGRSLCVFPEGGRSFDGSIMSFKKGIGVLALELNVPVIPAYIDGTFRALPRGAFIVRPAKIRVKFGERILPSHIEVAAKNRHPAADDYQIFSDELRKHVIELARNQ
ncbi:MAG: AMP-binding protein [Nitrospirae bacterium]|nr:AMP-binding protein [Nitrospirota bacterium]